MPSFVGRALRGYFFGQSLVTQRPALHQVFGVFAGSTTGRCGRPASMLFGIPAGIVAAGGALELRPLDYVTATTLALGGLSMPFWLGAVLLFLRHARRPTIGPVRKADG